MPTPPNTPGPAAMPGVLRGVAAFLVILVGYILLANVSGLSNTFFRLQDAWVALGFVVALAVLSVRWPAGAMRPVVGALNGRSVLVAPILFALLLWAGTYLVMYDYPLTRDEHMVVFDMGVFASGRLAMPLSPAWQPYALALVPGFLLDLPRHAALVSSYMPGNAALRTLFATFADPALMNPLLAALGLLALYDVAKRIFPGDRGSQGVALLLYLTSTQVIVGAMTDYAMTAHLACNLLWLALYLRGTRRAHLGALAVGFVATGLHQVVFHPLFVLPFLLQLGHRRAWGTLAFYVLGYAAIGLFWLSYPHIVASLSGLGGAASSGTGSGAMGFVRTRVLPLLLERDTGGLVLMAMNLLRFATWQNLALLPLAALAVPLARRNEGIAQPLYFGILFTAFAMFVLLPYQGHGWGYRYLHGLIGNAVLLAGYGWQRLTAERQYDNADGTGISTGTGAFLAIATAITLGFAMPFLLWTTHEFVRPYARVDATISRLPTDLLVVDTEGVAFAIDQVRNPADLSARPIRLSSKDLDIPALLALCPRGRIAFVGRETMQSLGLGRGQSVDSPHFEALRHAATTGGCRVVG